MKPFELKIGKLLLEVVKIFPARKGDMLIINTPCSIEYYPVSYKMYACDNVTNDYQEILCYNEGDNGEINYVSLTNGLISPPNGGETFFCNYPDYLNICELTGKEKVSFNDYVQAITKHQIVIPYIEKEELK